MACSNVLSDNSCSITTVFTIHEHYWVLKANFIMSYAVCYIILPIFGRIILFRCPTKRPT